MNIIFLFPRFKLLSGAERLILKLGGALIDQGHEITILCHQFDSSCSSILPPAAKLKVSGARLDFFRNRYANAALDYSRNGMLMRMLPEKADAVCCFGPALTTVPALKKRGFHPAYFCYEPPRFLYTDRETIRERLGSLRRLSGPAFAAYEKRDRALVAAADRVLSNSNFGKKQIQEIYHREASIITHGLNPYQEGTKRNEIRSRFGIGPSDILVSTVNYLHPRKRIDLFLEAVQQARHTNPNVSGLIAGEGPEMAALRAKAGSGIHFCGFVPEAELHEYYQASDIYLHTARLETFGLSVIEASANALPVVSVNEGGPLETVRDNETGYLQEANPEALASSLVRLAADAALRKSLGKQGFEYVRGKYTWEQGARDFVRAVTDK